MYENLQHTIPDLLTHVSLQQSTLSKNLQVVDLHNVSLKRELTATGVATLCMHECFFQCTQSESSTHSQSDRGSGSPKFDHGYIHWVVA